MDYTWESVDRLHAKGIIDAGQRSTLRGKILQEQNQFSGIHTKLVNNLVGDFERGFADLVVAIKATGTELGRLPKELAGEKPKTEYSGFFLAPAAIAAWHAFAILTGSPVITAAGHTVGESIQDAFMKRGINNDTVNVIAALADAVTQVGTGYGVGTVINKVTSFIPKAKDLVVQLQDDPAILKRLNDAIPASVAEKSAAVVANRDIAAAAAHAEKMTPKIKEARAGLQDLAKRAQAYEEQKLAEKAARRAQTSIAATDETNIAARIKSLDETHDLLAQAQMQSIPELSETRRTLDAAAGTMLPARQSAEQVMNAAQARKFERSADNLLEGIQADFSGVNPRLIKKLRDAGKTDQEIARIIAPKGGAPGYQDYLNAAKRSDQVYKENKALLESGKINIDETIDQASWIGKTKKDIAEITPGQAVDPIEIAANSLVMKDHQREIYNLVQTAEQEWLTGNKTPFWRMFAEFNRLREIDPNYRMPLQTAGQTLRIAGKPTVNVTRYQDKVVETGSWLAGENLNTIDEIEANALNIIARMKAMGHPDQVSIAAQSMNNLGEQVLRDPTFRDKARFVFVNSIMSGTDTIGRNVSGNLISAPWHYFEKITGAAASKALNPFLSAKHHVEAGYISEANDFITTWASSMWDATRYALTKRWDRLADMVPQQARASLFEGRYDLPVFTTTGTTNPFSGLFGRVVGTPVGIAQAADEVARVALYRAAVAERLKHQWLSSGSQVPWQQFKEHGLMNVAPDMHEYGVRMAGLMTYSDRPSVFGKLLMLGREMVPGTEFILPFIRTTDRLMAYGWNRSPVLSLTSSKTLTELASGDPLLRQEAVGRTLWANIVGAGLFLAARAKAPDGESFIAGGGPTDRRLARNLRDAGAIHPYTFWTPLGRFSYHLWQPTAAPLGMVADVAEIWDEVRDTTKAEGLWSGAVLALQTGMFAGSRNFMDTTYNQQIANIVSIFDNPSDESNTNRIVRQATASIVKGFVEPAILRQALRAYDPGVKEVYSIWDELARDIPGWGLQAKINPRTGESIRNPPRLLEGTPGGWFLPTAPIQSEDDAVAIKFLELKMPFPEFPKAYGGANPSESAFTYAGPLGPTREAGAGIQYTPEQIYKGKRYIHEADESGETADGEVKNLLADAEFHKQAPIVQQEQIYSIYNRRINVAVGKLREEYPELDEQLEAKRLLRGELRLAPEEREGFQMEQEAPLAAARTQETIEFSNPSIEVESQ